jgi:hypothetical protein
MDAIDGILSVLKGLSKRISRLEAISYPRWVYLQAPLTSASWDGDMYSTTAKTLIDLSAVFGVPAGAKAILAKVKIRDIDSDSDDDTFLILSPNNTAGQGPCVRSQGRTDWKYETQQLTVPCNIDGDVYYQCAATGFDSLEVHIEIDGYEV